MPSEHRGLFSAGCALNGRGECILLGILCVLANTIQAQDTKQTSVGSEIDVVVQQQIKAYNIPGLSVAAVQHGQIVFSKSYGWADLESRVLVTDDTLFRIGSITKSITATAALMMAERHQLDLNTPVQRYCPSYSEKQWPVTTRQLLAHMGGVRGFHSEGGVSSELLSDSHYVRVTDSLPLFANDPLTAKPGTHYEYSNYGYDLIGCALEGASGLRFDELVRKLILTPAGMTATTLDDSLMIIPRRSRYYTHAKDGTIRNAKSIDTSNRIPAAGLLSTANDLARFVLAVESGRLLSANSIHLMWTEQTTTEGEPNGYALGWMIRQLKDTSVIAHTGEQPGSSAILCIFPRSQAAYVVLANTDAAGLWKWANQIAELIQ
jgi:CubicO group peptidase (beta-lactamase class C family)